MSGCCSTASPATLSPFTTLNTPSGTPASCKSYAAKSVVPEGGRRAPRRAPRAPRPEPLLGRLGGGVGCFDGREAPRPALPPARRVVNGAVPAGFAPDQPSADPVADPLDVLLSLDC